MGNVVEMLVIKTPEEPIQDSDPRRGVVLEDLG